MLLFFATIGAGAGSLTALRSTGWLTAFIAIQLGVHMTVIILGGYFLARLPMQVSSGSLCQTNVKVFVNYVLDVWLVSIHFLIF